jgi:hypothetical protein
MKGLYDALEGANSRAKQRGNINSDTVFVASTNTIAAKEARGEEITQRASVFDKE